MAEESPRLVRWLVAAAYVAAAVTIPFIAERSWRLYVFIGLVGVWGAVLLWLYYKVTYSVREVLMVTILLRVAVFGMEPGLSDDTYRYVWDGLVQSEAGQNPYAFRPDAPELRALQDTPVFEKLNSPSFYSVYPPVSQYVFRMAASVSGGDWKTTYYSIKVIICVIEICGVWLLLFLVSTRKAILYAWNPVTVMELAGQGHTEALAAAFLILAVYLWRKRRSVLSVAAVTIAGLVKLYPLVLLPLVLRRTGWKGVLVSLVTVAWLVIPYVDQRALPNIRESLDLYVRYFEFNSGLYYTVKGIFRAITGDDFSKSIGPVFQWIFVATLPLIYWIDAKYRRSMVTGMVMILSAFFLLSTTIHPWYLLPLLAIIVLESRIRWHWFWLVLAGTGTYTLYIDGPYWASVWIGWTGWLLLAAVYHHAPALQVIQRVRGRRKYGRIREWVKTAPHDRILDLGAAEGYVGLAAWHDVRARVVLADVVDMNRTQLPWVEVDGKTLPFNSDDFDLIVLYFVLHHAEDADALLRQCRTVAPRAIVVESVFESGSERKRLRFLDRLVNRLRSGGKMKPQESFLEFRTAAAWRDAFADAGFRVEAERHEGGWLHRKVYFLLERSDIADI